MRLTCLVLSVLVLPGGCGSSNNNSTSDAGIDAAPDADPFCHYDCFGRAECTDGVVKNYLHTPVPCDQWEGSCPLLEEYTCERGCRLEGEVVNAADIVSADLCEENRAKQLGDPCEDESWCRPEVAVIDTATGSITTPYLTCDLQTNLCVERPAPVVEDWNAQCGLVPVQISSGVTQTNACSGGACLFVDDGICVRQGCSALCESDGECPVDSYCNHTINGAVSVCSLHPDPYRDLVCP